MQFPRRLKPAHLRYQPARQAVAGMWPASVASGMGCRDVPRHSLTAVLTPAYERVSTVACGLCLNISPISGRTLRLLSPPTSLWALQLDGAVRFRLSPASCGGRPARDLSPLVGSRLGRSWDAAPLSPRRAARFGRAARDPVSCSVVDACRMTQMI